MPLRRRKSRSTVGEVVLSTIVWATFPAQATYTYTLIRLGDGRCRAIYRRGNMVAARPVDANRCQELVEAVSRVTLPDHCAGDDPSREASEVPGS